MHLRKLTGLLASWLAVFVLAYLALNVTALRWLPRVLPLASVIGYLDADVRVLAQYSKRDVLPENYIAILGDSYAFGQGDWLYNRQHDIAPAYNAAHLIHEKTGRDVVSFALPASSSIKAYLEDPLSQMSAIRRDYPLPDPAVAVLYFYEGNDVVDNWQEYQIRYLRAGHDPSQLNNPQYFSAFIDSDILVKQKSKESFSGKYFLLGSFLCKLLVGETERLYNSFKDRWRDEPRRAIFKPQPRDHNVILVANRAEKIPDGLQVPPVALREDEIAVSMTVFAQSLHELQRRWPNTRLGVVYVPAVATAYDVGSETVNVYDTERGKNYSSARLLPSSDDTCARVRNIAEDAAVPFMDARPAIRAAARKQFVHGPEDWLHFNEVGYRELAVVIEQLLERMEGKRSAPATGCARLSG